MSEGQWWSQRWLMSLREMGVEIDVSTRGVRVQQLEIERGTVTAQVQVDGESCSVQVRLLPLGNSDWSNIVEALEAQALLVAQMQAGEIPPEVEQAFGEAGLTLFPTSIHELHCTCSCCDEALTPVANEDAAGRSVMNTDGGNAGWQEADDEDEMFRPCRALMATFNALGEMFDDDPWLIFQLRGREQPQIVSALHQKRHQLEPQSSPGFSAAPSAQRPASLIHRADSAQTAAAEAESETASSLTDQLDEFWGNPRQLKDLQHHIVAPQIELTLLRRLGAPPFSENGMIIYRQLSEVYHQVSGAALALAYAEDEDGIEGRD